MDTRAPMLAEKIRFLLENGFVQHSALADACDVSKQAITGWKRPGLAKARPDVAPAKVYLLSDYRRA